MSMTEVKNLRARCLDMESIEEVALHEVEFDIKESGGDFKPSVVQVMAKDPIDAIDYVRREYK
jgi:hypothetical protein